MKLRSAKADPNDTIKEALAVLRVGGIVVFPTDTVYGVGCDLFNPQAAEKIYKAKGRAFNKPLPALVSSLDQAFMIAESPPKSFEKLADKFWPGALTIVVKAKASVPKFVTSGGDTIGIRMPNHLIALKLISEFGSPLATTSANKSGELEPTTAEEVLAKLDAEIDLVDLIIDGGKTTSGVPSTVVDITVSPPRIIRMGGISEVEILNAILQ